ncbi:carboxymuconolactone decarboxylase family protein [Chitinophaga agri]|uniref:Carboxymuconolactone decarboxylase family protein n=1 Tax=Chitinophaga agri TaxID=2703787 RepID=A0A6B9ZCP9_9BACT|nr:carboxymuconolactone decarboxylase family protein [Chitinophaga agri]QHS59094.1 carboxymuconolactone decarboxylase family protein [Chitinophaga agri]
MGTRTFLSVNQPDLHKKMVDLDKAINESGIDKWHHELIKISASLFNGCAFCVDKHTQDALELGIPGRKIMLIPVWLEATKHFSAEEQLILRLTKAVTFIHEHGIEDELYDSCKTTFGEAYTANLIVAATIINAWNRVGVSFQLQPKF